MICLRIFAFVNFRKALYGDHPYHFPVYGYLDSVQEMSAQDCYDFEQRRDQSPWVICSSFPTAGN